MTITPTEFSEVLLIKSNAHKDNRGWFMERFRKDLLVNAFGHTINFCQENQVESHYGVIRGLHYQLPPAAQSKLISVVHGNILDVVVDIRKGSPNFGKHITIELSSKNQKQLFIPRGFAHGYACLSEISRITYLVDNYYNKATEASIAFDDTQLNINWQLPANKISLSKKDKFLPRFHAAQFFDYNQSLYD
tara:strand:- start:1257 stop:1829 length:573 start_codon:yes stop_codon:yes gene_type:complete